MAGLRGLAGASPNILSWGSMKALSTRDRHQAPDGGKRRACRPCNFWEPSLLRGRGLRGNEEEDKMKTQRNIPKLRGKTLSYRRETKPRPQYRYGSDIPRMMSDYRLRQIYTLKNVKTRSIRPLLLRQKIYERTLGLRKEGKSYKEIQRSILAEFNEWLGKSIISLSVRAKHKPNGKVIQVKKDGYWFGYVVGTILSDGRFSKHSEQADIELRVKDTEYAQTFAQALAKIGLKPAINQLTDGRLQVRAQTAELYHILKYNQWKTYINADKQVKLVLLKGFFDGDGIALFPSFVNSNKQLLTYIESLLKELKIRASPSSLIAKEGERRWNSQKKMWMHTKKDVYEILIHPEDYQRFLEVVGTPISRKRYLIELSIRTIQSYVDVIRSSNDWRRVCQKLRVAIGRNIKKKKDY
ncbi:MAG: hypothetical protein NXY59_10030 [Aigarchaeota archaeon]|nr:hypothetical protein [Candidatus Pelearchaeum maunauluense]